MKKYFIAVLFLSFALIQQGGFAQDRQTEYDNTQTVYQSLEYNTLAFNDLKQQWIISDPILIREIYNRFVVRDALRMNGSKMTLQTVKDKTQLIYDGRVVIDLRKRYYDDEIEYFAFVPESELQAKEPAYLADPIKDGFLLRDIVGMSLYDKIKTQGYFYSSLTKTNYDTKSGYFYDIYLNLLEPHLMYWNTTSGGRNKYTLSLFGKWGNDRIALPGQYMGQYVFGSELTYYKAISADPNNFLYDFRAGLVVTSGRMSVSDFAGKKMLKPSGQAFYAKATGDFLKYFIDGMDGYVVTVESQYTISDYKPREFGNTVKDTFYSVRNYLSLGLRAKNISDFGDFGNFYFGGGTTVYDVYHYASIPGTSKLVDLESKKGFVQKFTPGIFLEAGIARLGGLVQHDVSMQFTFDAGGYGSLGVISKVMLSDQMGFDIRVMQGFGSDASNSAWRPDTYIVFSPILRINY